MQVFLDASFDAAIEAFRGLLGPIVFFALLGMIVKGKSLFVDVKRALPQAGLNMQIMLFNVILVVPLLHFASVGMSNFFTGNGLTLFTPEHWSALPPLAVVFLALFLGDFVGYWRHRFEHSALLWPSHAVHHSDTEMTWTAIERFHPINRATTFFIDASALLILGFPPYAVAINSLVRHYYGAFIHADLPWTYGPLGRIFVSPAMHRWHHAANPAYFYKNYATVFSVFDQAFGTHLVPGPCTSRLGVTDDMAPTLAGQISYAFQPRAYKRLFKRKKSLNSK